MSSNFEQQTVLCYLIIFRFISSSTINSTTAQREWNEYSFMYWKLEADCCRSRATFAKKLKTNFTKPVKKMLYWPLLLSDQCNTWNISPVTNTGLKFFFVKMIPSLTSLTLSSAWSLLYIVKGIVNILLIKSSLSNTRFYVCTSYFIPVFITILTFTIIPFCIAFLYYWFYLTFVILLLSLYFSELLLKIQICTICLWEKTVIILRVLWFEGIMTFFFFIHTIGI